MTEEFISRTEALKDFESCNAENPNWTPQRVKTLLLRQQTADAVRVVHGRWVFGGDGCVICSKCNEEESNDNHRNFCPNCGAKMDGGDSE